MDDGAIIERGSYDELCGRGGKFAALIEEFGAKEHEAAKTQDEAKVPGDKKDEGKKAAGEPKTARKLVTGDERETGAVPACVSFLFSGRG